MCTQRGLLRLTCPRSDVGMPPHRHNSRGELEGELYSQYSRQGNPRVSYDEEASRREALICCG